VFSEERCSLNFDYRLKDRLLGADSDPGALKGSIWIFPEPKHGYARIRTNYFLPSPKMFEAINIIAKHVLSRGENPSRYDGCATHRRRNSIVAMPVFVYFTGSKRAIPFAL